MIRPPKAAQPEPADSNRDGVDSAAQRQLASWGWSSNPAKHHARGELRKINPYPTNWFYALMAPPVRRVFGALFDVDFKGGDQLPKSGPVIVTANHVSSLDPIVMILAIAYSGRWPRVLSRANLFDSKLVGWLMRLTEQIPVYRGAENASDALVAAEAALNDDAVILMYPEGTITFDELEWPMTIHSGAARLALATGAPVIPVGQWGANFIFPPRKRRRPRLRGQRIEVRFGPAVELSDLHGRQDDRQAVHNASVRILAAITQLTASARGERAADDVWDRKLNRRVPISSALLGSDDRVDADGKLREAKLWLVDSGSGPAHQEEA